MIAQRDESFHYEWRADRSRLTPKYVDVPCSLQDGLPIHPGTVSNRFKTPFVRGETPTS
jgi:hypothetical protein